MLWSYSIVKKLYILLFLLLSSFSFSQTTSVTSTIRYPDGEVFSNGTVTATFTPPTGIIDQNLYLLNGSSFPYIVTGIMDINGTFTITLTDDHIVRPLGGRWMFTVCSPATIQCTNSLQDVFGASIDLSTLISADVRPIFSSPGYVPIYFQDSEVDITNNFGGGIYFNYVSKVFRCWNGSTWSNCSNGGGGGGGITNFSAGNLSPLFTTNVVNPTTAPVLSFILSTAPAHTVYANETSSTAAPSFQTDALTINTSSPLGGGGLVHLGGSLSLTCAGCLISAVTSITATSPIVVTPSPITGVGVISCPTCGSSSGVTSVGLAAPTGIGISGSPVTTSGTLTWSMPSGWVTGDLLLGNGSNSVARLPIGTNNFVLTSNGTTALWQALAPPIIPDVQTRRVCAIIIGADNAASVLVNGDIAPQGRQCFIPYAATLQEVDIAADGGTPSLIIDKNRAGAQSNILSSALATATAGGISCAKASASVGYDGITTCSATLQNTSINSGDYLETTSATAGGVAKRMSIFITWTVN